MRTVFLDQLDPKDLRTLTRRRAVPDPEVRSAAAEICEQVRQRGAEAVVEYAGRHGGGLLRVPAKEMETAVKSLDPQVRQALDRSIEAIIAFHAAQIPQEVIVETHPGVEISRRWQPLHRVGAYVPGGSAPLPSTALMTVIPARLAGVAEIVVTSPAAGTGEPHPVTVAAALAGATEFWAVGGAQAIAALAFGAGDLDPVEKIVGPGNPWVTAAKLAVFGAVAIDLPAGPSEVLVLADASADPRLVAVDLLCQAEHGPDSPAVLVTTDPTLPAKVEAEIEGLLPRLSRREILEKTLAVHSLVVIAPDPVAARRFAQSYAAEHVSIATADPETDAAHLTGAGSVYIGAYAAESAGDYATGANHVLPTGGLAGACSPLGVEDFGSYRQEQRITREGLARLRSTITTLAGVEGLDAHALAASMRFQEKK
ncbi:MAG TPA: histidinol dehydrogenase [Acidimicrobiia bacterium]|nr:histidinol dehydrogenase [Acidimicrobiia bacterium]